MVEVLITGCGLTINEHFRIWGDLWSVGECYVFNACGSEEGLASPFPDHTKQLVVDDGGLHRSYFQRRNVFVVPKSDASLNLAAATYLLDPRR